MNTDKFDFELEGGLSNTFSVFEQIIFTSKEESKVLLVLHDIQNIIPHAKAGLEKVFDFQINNREEIYNRLEFCINETNRIINENDLSYKDERLSILNIFSNIIKEVFKKPIQEAPILKLKINAPANVIYDLIKQLKTISIEDSKPFLSQNNRQLAEFLVNYVEGFEKLSISTVSTEIGREQTIKKTSIKVKQQN